MITDRELRFECLKMAVALAPGVDPRPFAEALVDYVRLGIKKGTAPQPAQAAES